MKAQPCSQPTFCPPCTPNKRWCSSLYKQRMTLTGEGESVTCERKAMCNTKLFFREGFPKRGFGSDLGSWCSTESYVSVESSLGRTDVQDPEEESETLMCMQWKQNHHLTLPGGLWLRKSESSQTFQNLLGRSEGEQVLNSVPESLQRTHKNKELHPNTILAIWLQIIWNLMGLGLFSNDRELIVFTKRPHKGNLQLEVESKFTTGGWKQNLLGMFSSFMVCQDVGDCRLTGQYHPAWHSREKLLQYFF